MFVDISLATRWTNIWLYHAHCASAKLCICTTLPFNHFYCVVFCIKLWCSYSSPLSRFYPGSFSTTACPGPPQNLRLAVSVPPNVDLLWDRPSTADMWSFMYRVGWQNGTTAVGGRADMNAILSDLEAVTEYAVTIIAFTDSTLCAEQSVSFTFSTTQSESYNIPGLCSEDHTETTFGAVWLNKQFLCIGLVFPQLRAFFLRYCNCLFTHLDSHSTSDTVLLHGKYVVPHAGSMTCLLRHCPTSITYMNEVHGVFP